MDIRRSYAPPSIIKNIQHITTTFSGSNSKTLTVANYNAAKTYVNTVGIQTAGLSFQGVSFDSATQITINLSGASSNNVQIDLIEFY